MENKKAFINLEIDLETGDASINATGTNVQKLTMLSHLVEAFRSGEIMFEKPSKEYNFSLDFVLSNPEEASAVLDAAVAVEISRMKKKEKIF